MPLTLKLLEELKEFIVKVPNVGALDVLAYQEAVSESMPSLISAAEWALENGFKPE